MPKIAYKDIDTYLEGLGKQIEASRSSEGTVFFVFGDEALCKTVFHRLRSALLPASWQDLNCDVWEGSDENFPEILERVNTYSLLSGPRVVVAMDAKVFESRQDLSGLWQKTRQAYDEQKMADAARSFLRILSLKERALPALSTEDRFDLPGLSKEDLNETDWLDDIMAYCNERNLSVPRAMNSAGLLQRAVEKGLPAGNYLIVTAAAVDKRRSLYKSLLKHAELIDCSVPGGDRHADRQAQRAFVQKRLRDVLARNDKSMASDGVDALLDMTGFDLRAIDTSLEKLIMYVGDRKTILREDIRNTLVRTKQDPIYAFTNAVTDRSLKDALFYLNTLMSDGPGALRAEQMLVAIHNQIRKLLLAKDFSASTLGSSWYSACPYNLFQQNVLPLIKAYDRMLLDCLQEWQADLEDRQNAQGAKKKKANRVSDALIASKGASPYPIYLMLKKAERFSRRHLLACMVNLNRADRRLKTGGTDKKLILEELLINICRDPASESAPDAADPAVAATP